MTNPRTIIKQIKTTKLRLRTTIFQKTRRLSSFVICFSIKVSDKNKQKDEIGYGDDRRERSTLPMGAKVKPDRFKRPKEDKKKWVPKPTLERKEGKKSGLGKGEVFDRFGNKMAGAKKSFGETKFGTGSKFNKADSKPSKYAKDDKPKTGGKFKKDFAKNKTFDKPAAPAKKKFWR